MSYCFYKMKSKCLLTKYFFRFMQTPYTIVISVRRILFLTYTRTYNDYRKSPMQITATSDSFFLLYTSFYVYVLPDDIFDVPLHRIKVLKIIEDICMSSMHGFFMSYFIVFLLFLKTAVKSHSSGIYFKY